MVENIYAYLLKIKITDGTDEVLLVIGTGAGRWFVSVERQAVLVGIGVDRIDDRVYPILIPINLVVTKVGC